MAGEVKLIGNDPTTHADPGKISAEWVYFLRYQALADGVISSIRYHLAAAYSTQIRVAIFSDGADGPASVLNQIVSGTLEQGTNIISFPDTAVEKNKYYWVAFHREYSGGVAARGNIIPYDTEWIIHLVNGYQWGIFTFTDNPTGWHDQLNSRQYAIAAYGALATGGTGRLIGGPGKHPLSPALESIPS